MSGLLTGNKAAYSFASSYQRWRSSRLGRVTDALEHKLVIELASPLQDCSVLDVGCGDGGLSDALCDAGARVTGLDSDPQMLALAQSRLERSCPSARLIEGSASLLPFGGDSFDRVTAITLLCVVDDPQGVVCELARVLRPGGTLVLGELAQFSVWAAIRRARGWLGSETWKSARHWRSRELRRLVVDAGLEVNAVRGAVFYPPIGWVADAMAGLDPILGRYLSHGALIALSASKLRQC